MRERDENVADVVLGLRPDAEVALGAVDEFPGAVALHSLARDGLGGVHRAVLPLDVAVLQLFGDNRLRGRLNADTAVAFGLRAGAHRADDGACGPCGVADLEARRKVREVLAEKARALVDVLGVGPRHGVGRLLGHVHADQLLRHEGPRRGLMPDHRRRDGVLRHLFNGLAHFLHEPVLALCDGAGLLVLLVEEDALFGIEVVTASGQHEIAAAGGVVLVVHLLVEDLDVASLFVLFGLLEGVPREFADAGLLHDRAADGGGTGGAVGVEPPDGVGRVAARDFAPGGRHDAERGLVREEVIAGVVREGHVERVPAGADIAEGDLDAVGRTGRAIPLLLAFEGLLAVDVLRDPFDGAGRGLGGNEVEGRLLARLVEREDVPRLRLADDDREGCLFERDAEDVEGAVGVRVGLHAVVDLLEVLPALAGEVELHVGVGLRRLVDDGADIERDGRAVERHRLALERNLADLFAPVGHAVREVEDDIAEAVAADAVRLVLAEAEREDGVLLRVWVEREEDVRLDVGRGGDAVVDGHREALVRVAAVVLLDLKRPVALALAADGDVSGVDRRDELDRRPAEVADAGLDALERAVRHRLGAGVCCKVKRLEAGAVDFRESHIVLHGVGDTRRRAEEEGLDAVVEAERAGAVDPHRPRAVGLLGEIDVEVMSGCGRKLVPFAKDVEARIDHAALPALGVFAEGAHVRAHPLRRRREAAVLGVLEGKVGVLALGLVVADGAVPDDLCPVIADETEIGRT